jgi:hypothetical protein
VFWDVGALVLALGLVAATTAVTTVLLRPVGRADAASTAGVVALALVSTAVLVTGALGGLRAPALLGVHALQASLALAVVVRRGGWQVPRPTWRRPEWRRPGWESLLVALAVLALGWQLLVALVLPPFDYDGLSYHLTTVAAWVQSESLAPSPMTPCCAYYPFNAELPSAWLVVLVGSDALVGTVQVAAAALAGAAVAAIARTAGLSRRGAVAAGALFVLTPALLAQAPTSYVDVLLAALVLAGLQGLARYAVDARAVRLVVPALCAGLLSGTKGTGLLWAAALVAVTAVVGIVHVRRSRARPAGCWRRSRAPLRPAPRWAAAGTCGASPPPATRSTPSRSPSPVAPCSRGRSSWTRCSHRHRPARTGPGRWRSCGRGRATCCLGGSVPTTTSSCPAVSARCGPGSEHHCSCCWRSTCGARAVLL